METTLHAQLKRRYAGESNLTEVRQANYRIDAVADGRLIEIQQSGLSAIRRKIAALVQDHPVLVVKPVVRRTRIFQEPAVPRAQAQAAGNRRKGVSLRKDGAKASGESLVERHVFAQANGRLSPKRGVLLDVFQELVHFAAVFPHARLQLDILLVDIDELRKPRKRLRWGRPGHVVLDRRLAGVVETVSLTHGADLWKLLPLRPAETFDSRQLGEALSIPRWRAQQVAYCLQKAGATVPLHRTRQGWNYRIAA